jgi:hypothetical protein
MLTLFFKECKTIAKSIIFLVFICAIVLFHVTQFGEVVERQINEYHTNEETWTGSLLRNPLVKPQEGAESYGYRYVEVPEQIMSSAVSSLLLDWRINQYTVYPFGFGRRVTLNDKKQAEIAQVIFDITGVDAAVLFDVVAEIRLEYINNNRNPYDVDYSDIIPIIITYEEYKEKMKQVDRILGGTYGEAFTFRANVPLTYEEALAEYNAFINEDRITGAYARLFCDYMGIMAALLSIFVPVAFLMRDKRAKVNELIFSRNISSVKFILARYAALVFMMVIPFLILSLLPSISLIRFASANNLPVDIFAFAKYILAWIFPTLMMTTAVAFVITTITDTPVAIAVQFIWSFINLTVGGFAAYAGGTGNLIHYGMNLMIRHNTVGNLQYYQDNIAQIAVNRIVYAVLSIILIALTIFIYEQKRRGEIDVRSSLRKIFRNRKSAD